MATPTGMTRGKALLLGLAFFGLGAGGYGLFQLAGFGRIADLGRNVLITSSWVSM